MTDREAMKRVQSGKLECVENCMAIVLPSHQLGAYSCIKYRIVWYYSTGGEYWRALTQSSYEAMIKRARKRKKWKNLLHH